MTAQDRHIPEPTFTFQTEAFQFSADFHTLGSAGTAEEPSSSSAKIPLADRKYTPLKQFPPQKYRWDCPQEASVDTFSPSTVSPSTGRATEGEGDFPIYETKNSSKKNTWSGPAAQDNLIGYQYPGAYQWKFVQEPTSTRWGAQGNQIPVPAVGPRPARIQQNEWFGEEWTCPENQLVRNLRFNQTSRNYWC